MSQTARQDKTGRQGGEDICSKDFTDIPVSQPVSPCHTLNIPLLPPLTGN